MYPVEAVSAALRHDLKRLACKSRYFSQRIDLPFETTRLFLYCYNPILGYCKYTNASNARCQC